MTYDPDIATRRVVLAEATPTETLGPWTQGSGAAWSARLDQWFGGPVSGVTTVKQGSTELTEVASAALVKTTHSSWYWDSVSSVLYTSPIPTTPSFVAAPDISAAFTSGCLAPDGSMYVTRNSAGISKRKISDAAWYQVDTQALGWQGATATPDGDILAAVYSGDIYQQTAGSGSFVATGQTSRTWLGIAADLDGDVWACTADAGVFVRRFGTSTFVAVASTPTASVAMCAAPDGSVYLAVTDGTIYRKPLGSDTFADLSQTARKWRGIWATPNGNVYAVTRGGSPDDIYMRTGGAGDFVALSQTDRLWTGGMSDRDGNCYALVNSPGTIYKQSNVRATDYTMTAIVSFVSDSATVTETRTLTQWERFSGQAMKTTIRDRKLYRSITGITSNDHVHYDTLATETVGESFGSYHYDPATERIHARAPWQGSVVEDGNPFNWTGLACHPNSDVYAAVWNGDIYLQTAGVGSFAALSQTSRQWNALAVAPNGDVWATVYNGDIYKSVAGTGTFTSVAAGTKLWRGITVAPNGDVYASVDAGDIWINALGTGTFTALGGTTRAWTGMAAMPNGDIYAATSDAGIFKRGGGAGAFADAGFVSGVRAWYDLAASLDGRLFGITYLDVEFGDYLYELYASTSTMAPIVGVVQGQGASANADGQIYQTWYGGGIYSVLCEPMAVRVVQAETKMFFSTDGVVVNQTDGDPSTGVYYEPWIVGGVPRLTRQVADLVFGSTIASQGDVELSNGHGVWHHLLPTLNWKNKPIEFLVAEYENGTQPPGRTSFVAATTMLIEDATADEEMATLRLVSAHRLLETELPARRFAVADYPDLGNGVEGAVIPLLWGRRRVSPPLTNTTAYGTYTVADATKQTLSAVHAVYAVASNGDGVRYTLTLSTHYTVDLTACTVTVVSATYTWETYRIEIDVSGPPDPYGGPTTHISTFAGIVRNILQVHLGIPTALLNTGSFDTSSNSTATAPLGVYLSSPRSVASLLASAEPGIPSLERSVLSTLRPGTDGRWEVVSITDSQTPVATLVKSDFVSFKAQPKLARLSSAVSILYDQAGDGSWSVSAAEDLNVEYRAGKDAVALATFLTIQADADTLAARALLLFSRPPVEIEFELRGGALAQAPAGSVVYVTFAPVPIAGQGIDGLLWISRLDLSLHPTLQISGRLLDLSFTNNIGRWTEDGAPDWDAASGAERATSGFWCDDEGRVDPSDDTTTGESVWW